MLLLLAADEDLNKAVKVLEKVQFQLAIHDSRRLLVFKVGRGGGWPSMTHAGYWSLR